MVDAGELPLGTVVKTTLLDDHDMVLLGHCAPEDGYAYAAAPLPAGQVLNHAQDDFLQTFGVALSDIVSVSFLGWLGQATPSPVDPLRSLLPLGSVVEVSHPSGTVQPAIIGLYAPLDPKGTMYDYLGYRWPEGYRKDGGTDCYFNTTDIVRILHLGFVDASVQEYCANLPIFARSKRISLPFLATKKFFSKKLELSDE